MLWNALERVVPDIRKRAKVSYIVTPLTHQHFVRRHKGTYGPGIIAGEVGYIWCGFLRVCVGCAVSSYVAWEGLAEHGRLAVGLSVDLWSSVIALRELCCGARRLFFKEGGANYPSCYWICGGLAVEGL